MSNKVIPDTNDIRVAMIAAALELVSKNSRGSSTKTLDNYISDFEKAYKAVSQTINPSPTTTTSGASAVHNIDDKFN